MWAKAPTAYLSGVATSADAREGLHGDTYLVSHNKALSIRSPRQSKGFAETFDLVDHGSGLDVPKLDRPVIANTCQLQLLDGIEGNALYGSYMTLQFGGLPDIGLFDVPFGIGQSASAQQEEVAVGPLNAK